MAQTYEECTRINRISQETGIPCFVAYYRRYLPYFQKVKELVEKADGVLQITSDNKIFSVHIMIPDKENNKLL
mgnify:FL=1